MATTTISGQWKLNAILHMPSYTIEQTVTFTSNTESYGKMKLTTSQIFYSAADGSDAVAVFALPNSWTEGYQIVDFGSTPQTVDITFYSWIYNNAIFPWNPNRRQTPTQSPELTKVGEYLIPGSPDKADSLFGALEAYFPDWIDDPEPLDTLYVLRSGDKLVPTAMRGVLNRTRRWLAAAPVIAKLYGVKWAKLYKLTELEYNPIENYNMTEEEMPNLTTTRTPNLTDTENRDLTDTRTPNLTYTDTGTVKNGGTVGTDTDMNVIGAGDSNGNVYGFNSTTPVGATQTDAATQQRTVGKADSNKVTEDKTQTNDLKRVESGTDTSKHTGTNTTVRSGTEKTEQTGNRLLKRSGNIGVTTSQQMAESEIALWQWNFYSQVFEDLDKLLTVPIY